MAGIVEWKQFSLTFPRLEESQQISPTCLHYPQQNQWLDLKSARASIVEFIHEVHTHMAQLQPHITFDSEQWIMRIVRFA